MSESTQVRKLQRARAISCARMRAHAHALALCGCTGESIGVEGATAVTARNFYFLRKSIQLLNLALATDGVTLSGILVHEPA